MGWTFILIVVFACALLSNYICFRFSQGDSFKYGNEGEEEGVDCVVTGGFGKGEFVVYYPGRGEAEVSGV